MNIVNSSVANAGLQSLAHDDTTRGWGIKCHGGFCIKIVRFLSRTTGIPH